MGKRDYTKGAVPYPFIAMPKQVVVSDEWQRLTFRGRAFALDLTSQYTGKNNGRLCPGFEVMRRSGWTSKDQLAKAKAELLGCSFAIRTRMGRAPKTAEWIGFTWWRLHWHESMEVERTKWPYLNFVTIESAQIDPNEERGRPNGKTVSVPRSTGR